jgi:hypothetical protein
LGAAGFFSASRRTSSRSTAELRPPTKLDLGSLCGLFERVQETTSGTGSVEILPPRVFTPGAILLIATFGVLLVAPVLLSLLAVTLIKLSIFTVLIPLLTMAVTAYFLPCGLGNPVARRLVRSLGVGANEEKDGFIVQVTMSPRIRSGLRAVIEDADDLGYLSFTDSELVFRGDSVRLRLPWKQIAEVRPQNIGWRGRYLYGSRIKVTLTGIPNVEAVTFSERSSLLLPTSKRVTRKLHERICAALESARAVEKR